MWFTHARTYQDNHTHITFNSHFRYLIEETKELSNFLSREISLNLPNFSRMHHKGYARYDHSIYNRIKYSLAHNCYTYIRRFHVQNYDVVHLIYYYIIFISAVI